MTIRVPDRTTRGVAVERYLWGDDPSDWTAAFGRACADTDEDRTTLLLEGGKVYDFQSPFAFAAALGEVHWERVGNEPAVLRTHIPSGIGWDFRGVPAGQTALTANLRARTNQVRLANQALAVPGRLLQIASRKAWPHDPRAPAGLLSLVTGSVVSAVTTVDSTTLELDPSTPTDADYTDRVMRVMSGSAIGEQHTVVSHDGPSRTVVTTPFDVNPDVTTQYDIYIPGHVGHVGAVSGATSNTFELDPTTRTPGASYIGLAVTLLSGPGAGQQRIVGAYDLEAGEATLTRPWKVIPTSETRYVFGQYQTGELHAVDEVRADHLRTEVPLWHGYDAIDDTYGDANEDVTVSLVDPITVHVEGVRFEWVPPVDATSLFQAIRTQYALGSRFDEVVIDHPRRVGFQIERSYRTDIYRAAVHRADGLYMGYGAQSQSSSFMVVTEGEFHEGRRGVDFGTTVEPIGIDELPSHDGLMADCKVYGGGTREDGTDWGPTGLLTSESTTDVTDPNATPSPDNYGGGSHGGSHGARFEGNHFYNVATGLLHRGRGDIAIDNEVHGDCDYATKFWYGSEYESRGWKYVHPALIGDSDQDERWYMESRSFSEEPWNKWMLLRFAEIIGSDSYDPGTRGRIVIADNDIRGVLQDFLYLSDAGRDEWADLELTGNHVTFWPLEEGRTVHLINANNNGDLIRLTDLHNTHVERNGAVWKRYRPQMPIDAATFNVALPGPPRKTRHTFKHPAGDLGFVAGAGMNFSKTSTPLSSTGGLVFSVTRDPEFRTSTWDVVLVLPVTASVAGHVIATVWGGFSANQLIAVARGYVASANGQVRLVVNEPNFLPSPGSTPPGDDRTQTFTVRLGPESGTGATLWVGLDGLGNSLLGGNDRAVLEITERVPGP